MKFWSREFKTQATLSEYLKSWRVSKTSKLGPRHLKTKRTKTKKQKERITLLILALAISIVNGTQERDFAADHTYHINIRNSIDIDIRSDVNIDINFDFSIHQYEY